ncbi:AraC family transcriptional regulator [Fluviicola sp.]|uniref:helix-turn-helix domain-containing protein n=1 Tax=Fluviicola sp. TaxID=1917219 RepID=UPI0031DF905E
MMLLEHHTHELFGKMLFQKVVVKPPFEFPFPVTDNACFLYMQQGNMQYSFDNEAKEFPAKHSLLLNCVTTDKQISNSETTDPVEIVIIHFHPSILKKIYDKELPELLLKPQNIISNQSIEQINNDFLIQKYIEGLMFYFENPSIFQEDILILKLKEIILLLSLTPNAEKIRIILSQLFSRAAYSFKQVVEAHLFSQLTIEELAQHTNLSVSSFKREFAKWYNDTPASYIKTKKLERAAELLLKSDLRITEIAFDCGFNDVANFSKSFTDQFGYSPSNFRLTQKNA